MTQDELQLLTQLAYKIEQAPAVQKDPQAEELIRNRISSRPDAVYLLTQTVLVQNLALEQARKQIQELQARAPQAAQQFAPQAPSQFAPQVQPQAGPFSFFGSGGGGSSFLRSAGTTAAGIAAGALAFEGIRHLMGGFEGGGFGGGHQASGFLGGDPMGTGSGETIINNYYGSDDDALAATDESYDNADTSNDLMDDYSDDSASSDYSGSSDDV